MSGKRACREIVRIPRYEKVANSAYILTMSIVHSAGICQTMQRKILPLLSLVSDGRGLI